MSRRKAKQNPKNALLGDLESIRTLLDDDELEDGDALPLPEPDVDDIDVPMLEDVVAEENLPENAGEEDAAANDAVADNDVAREEAETPGLNHDLFQALLSDEWRNSAGEVLKQARSAIAEHRTDWSPEETDTLNDALKVRIDQTIQGWMRGMVVTHIADLHETLLRELSDELKITIDNIIEQRNETTDGK